jgi:TM2 domain-containing membrane protein YozV
MCYHEEKSKQRNTMDPNNQQPTQDTPEVAVPTTSAAQPQQKSFLVAILLSVLVGSLGVDRFYMGYTGLGILKLITAGGCGIWYIVDIILIATGNLKDSNGLPLKQD